MLTRVLYILESKILIQIRPLAKCTAGSFFVYILQIFGSESHISVKNIFFK